MWWQKYAAYYKHIRIIEWFEFAGAYFLLILSLQVCGCVLLLAQYLLLMTSLKQERGNWLSQCSIISYLLSIHGSCSIMHSVVALYLGQKANKKVKPLVCTVFQILVPEKTLYPSRLLFPFVSSLSWFVYLLHVKAIICIPRQCSHYGSF